MGQGSSEICCTHCCSKELQQSRSTEDALLGQLPADLLDEKDCKSSTALAALPLESEASPSFASGLDGLKPPSSRDEKTTLATETELNVEVKALSNDKAVSDEKKEKKQGRCIEFALESPGTPDGPTQSREVSDTLSPASSSRLKRKQTRTKSLTAALSRMVQFQAPDKAAEQRNHFWNANLPSDYSWLEVVLWTLGKNQASSLACIDMVTGRESIPLFFVLGACPNTFCGMQAVMYSSSAINNTDIDFWWVKPTKGDSTRLESSTLCKHVKGQHKNDPGRSKSFYKPLADLFQGEGSTMNGVQFSIRHGTNGLRDPRACIEQVIGGIPTRHWLTMIWQEEWTSNPFAFSKYIKGKIVYQKDADVMEFYTKAYSIQNGTMTLSETEDPPFPTPVPGIQVKHLP
eukprot:TRINITY_DN89777_c0_g1_i1.p1 TRINITY_DN89777_c0_g1~~TRINITY_DN89777_c0_g1_i1.p1  ORF type:complete len:403 (+),score=69.73 TRINITY_DN89777_c0_g1_i1:51-1259(+)